MGTKDEEPLYKEIYRGVSFQQTCTGVWIFDEIPHKHPFTWAAFSRKEDPETVEGMRMAIDRYADA